MKMFNVTFQRTIDVEHGKASEKRRVTGVKAKSPETAKNKAFRKICFHTRYDHWVFFNITETEEEKLNEQSIPSN